MVQNQSISPSSQGDGPPLRHACRLVRLREVLHRTGLSRSTVYRRMEAGTFPKPYPIGGKIVAWAESDIDRWIADLIDRAER